MAAGFGTRLAAALALALVAGPAVALTEQQIAAGAARAGKGLGNTVKRLAGARLQGRDNATPGSERAQRLLIQQLRKISTGLSPGAGRDAYRQPFTRSGRSGVNVVGLIPGRELPDEYVLLGAHYDHFGLHGDPTTGRCSSSVPLGGGLCPGATDNASGTAAVLAIGRAIAKLPTPPRRSIVLAFWDAEEDGLVGSAHYVANPLVPLATTRACLNFDIQGNDLLPSLARSTFGVGGETGGSALQAFVAAADAAEGDVDVRPISYIFGQERSDYKNFVAGGVPTVFFGDSTNGCYHTVHDVYDIVNRKKLAAQARVGYRAAMALAETDAPPPFRGVGASPAVYGDAVSLDAVFTEGLADLALFSPADQVVVQQTQAALHGIVSDGPAAFDAGDLGVLFNAALQGIDAIARIGCPRR